MNFGNLIIRADASSKIGAGHMLRCLALAQAWEKRGGSSAFLSCCDSIALRRRILDEGFDMIPIEEAHPDPTDLQSTLNILQQFRTKDSSPVSGHPSLTSFWLALDGYHFDSNYQRTVSNAGYPLLVIDDMGHLPHYHANAVLNQNMHAEDLEYRCDADTRLLLGTHYALLRKEFLVWRNRERESKGNARKLLITLGGSDANNVTIKVIKALNLINDSELEVKIVGGPSNRNMESLKRELSHSTFRFSLLPHVENMTELMAWADMAVSGGGTTCWEMAYMGLPNLIIVLAENQNSVARALDRNGCSIELGKYHELTSERIAEEIEKLMGLEGLRKAMSNAGRHLIDGCGVDRVIDVMEEVSSIRGSEP